MDKSALLMRTHLISLSKRKNISMMENMFLTVQENKVLEVINFIHLPEN